MKQRCDHLRLLLLLCRCGTSASSRCRVSIADVTELVGTGCTPTRPSGPSDGVDVDWEPTIELNRFLRNGELVSSHDKRPDNGRGHAHRGRGTRGREHFRARSPMAACTDPLRKEYSRGTRLLYDVRASRRPRVGSRCVRCLRVHMLVLRVRSRWPRHRQKCRDC